MFNAKNLHFDIDDRISTYLYGDLVVLEKTIKINAINNRYIVRNIKDKSLYRFWPYTGVFEPIGIESYEAA